MGPLWTPLQSPFSTYSRIDSRPIKCHPSECELLFLICCMVFRVALKQLCKRLSKNKLRNWYSDKTISMPGNDSLNSHLRRPPVRIQSLDFGKLPHRRQRFLERGAIVFHHTGAALKLVHGQAGE